MNILITGSNGFLGTYFIKFNNLNEHNIIYATTSDCKGCVKFEKQYSDIEKILNDTKIDIIVHLAAQIPSSFQECTYENNFLPNVEMMNNLYNFAVKRNIFKFIYISGFGSMDNPEQYDIKDFYTLSKITGEHYCSLMEAASIQTASLRVSSPYGEFYKAKNVLNLFVEKAIKNEDITIYGTGKRSQNFTYAGDVVNAIKLCINKEINGVYEIVSEENTSMLELAKSIISLTNSSSKIITGKIPDPQEDYCPAYNYERAKALLSYEPKFSIEDGLKLYIDWKKENLGL